MFWILLKLYIYIIYIYIYIYIYTNICFPLWCPRCRLIVTHTHTLTHTHTQHLTVMYYGAVGRQLHSYTGPPAIKICLTITFSLYRMEPLICFPIQNIYRYIVCTVDVGNKILSIYNWSKRGVLGIIYF